jgi:hypothetical protein
MHKSLSEAQLIQDELTLLETVELDIFDPDGNKVAAQQVPIHIRPDGTRFIKLTLSVHEAEENGSTVSSKAVHPTVTLDRSVN